MEFYRIFYPVFGLFLSFLHLVTVQQVWERAPTPYGKNRTITWCVVNKEEFYKCTVLSKMLHTNIITVGYDVISLKCSLAINKEECMEWIDQEKATLTSLDAGEVFEAGRFHSLVPISQEGYGPNNKWDYSVAVIKKGSLPDVASISGLRGKKACFAGVGSFSGWITPVYVLLREGGLEVVDCNNHVKSVTNFFGPSCAVKALSDNYNPLGDNSDKLCVLCIGKVPGERCTEGDPYAGYEGAFRCLVENGEVAFLKQTTVLQLADSDEYPGLSKNSFELLCRDGSRAPVDNFKECNWGKAPSNAIVTTSAASYEDRKLYQKFLQKISEKFTTVKPTTQRGFTTNNQYNPNQNNQYSPTQGNQYNPTQNNQYTPNAFNPYYPYSPYNSSQPRFKRQSANNDDPYIDPSNINRNEYGVRIDPYGLPPKRISSFEETTSGPDDSNTTYESFDLFGSELYGSRKNLIFQDYTRNFVSLSENQQSYSGFLENSLNLIYGVRSCPVDHMTLCVTSDAEFEKCVKMRVALKAQLVKPEMRCEKGHSQIHCMEAIKSGAADVTVLDASDVYTAGLNYELVPFISEVYNLGEPYYYVVAVAKEADPDTEMTYLKGKYTCHGGINTAAGWVIPLAFLISNSWIRPYGCNSIRAAAEYFTKSCVPGALSTEYNTGVPYDNLCDLCHGSSFRYCRRDASDDYYGHTGAFRCLVEGGGHVAFVKHTTVMENTGGKRKEWWARDALMDDFELLCPDGTRAEVQNYATCNMGKVKANAIVTRGGYSYNETQINAYINLFGYAQTLYGRKNADEFSFSMFSSPPPFSDLIFQDATQQLMIIPPDQRYYSVYLGENFMKARRIVDCYAASVSIHSSFFITLLSSIVALFLSKV
ncbi:melanotransferrin [Agrilus planipennis]|uniref:Melanotransferrin n=1 Tax=Agrilus planipennis TaxID=224129 RepID=A0A7F5RN51_AGRPL|nr:melanotransferrin [Agrilus planipennis]